MSYKTTKIDLGKKDILLNETEADEKTQKSTLGVTAKVRNALCRDQ